MENIISAIAVTIIDQSLGFAGEFGEEIEEVSRYEVEEKSDEFVREVIALALERRVPEHVFGRVGQRCLFGVQTELFPSDRVLVARRYVVHRNIHRSAT